MRNKPEAAAQPQHSIPARKTVPNAKHGEIPDALRNFDALPGAAFVRLPVAVALDASSPATIWRKVKKGTFPAPVKMSEKITAWNVGALRRHFAALAGNAS